MEQYEGHILVVDDNSTNLKLACDVLEWAGFTVSQAADAGEVLEALKGELPDLVLMDLGLPGMDGLTLTRKLKAEERTRDLCIVALTAFAMKGDAARFIAAGCDGYIAKPIETRTIAAQVAGHLAGKARP